MIYYIRQDAKSVDYTAKTMALFTRPWFVMLGLGGLGHQLQQPKLYLSYWTVFLACFVLRAAINQDTNMSFKVSSNRKEAERGWK